MGENLFLSAYLFDKSLVEIYRSTLPYVLVLAITVLIITYFPILTMGLVHFNPKIPEGISVVFYIHLFLVSVLFAYFPFSKLVHMAGVFLSPTRNLASNNREVRHINPWNPPVKVHTYDEYEDDFREKMIAAGIPVERKTAAPPDEE